MGFNLFGSKDIAVLDIGAYSVKSAVFSYQKQRVIVKKVNEVLVDINDNKSLENILRNTIKNFPSNVDMLLTAIPSRNIVIKTINLPDLNKKQITNILKHDIGNYLPYTVENVEQVVFDYCELKDRFSETNGLLIATKRTVVDDFLLILQDLVSGILVNVKPLSLMSILEYIKEDHSPVIILDIGKKESEIVVADEEEFYMSRSIDIGGDDFTKAIMDNYELGYQEAEKLKYETNIFTEDVDDSATSFSSIEDEFEDNDHDLLSLSDSLSSSKAQTRADFIVHIARRLIIEIDKSINFFLTQHTEKNINKIYVTGNGSRLKGLLSFLQSEMAVSVNQLGFSSTKFKFIDESFKKEALYYGTLIGTALSEINKFT